MVVHNNEFNLIKFNRGELISDPGPVIFSRNISNFKTKAWLNQTKRKHTGDQ